MYNILHQTYASSSVQAAPHSIFRVRLFAVSHDQDAYIFRRQTRSCTEQSADPMMVPSTITLIVHSSFHIACYLATRQDRHCKVPRSVIHAVRRLWATEEVLEDTQAERDTQRGPSSTTATMDELAVPPEARSVTGGSSSGSPSSASGPRTPPTPQPHPVSPTARSKRKAEDAVQHVDSDSHETASPAQEATVVPPPRPRFLQPAELSASQIGFLVCQLTVSYPLNNGSTITSRAAGPWAPQGEQELSPEDDPDAHRGIPIFRPSMEEFKVSLHVLVALIQS